MMINNWMFVSLFGVILFFFINMVSVLGDNENIPMEYCLGENFHPICKDDEVISIQKALYGFMKLGRCIEEDSFGFLGCSSDQKGLMDKACSGLRECNVPVLITNKEVLAQIPCPTYYLEATYICQRVVSVTGLHCNSPVHVTAKSSSTYISSFTSRETSCGLGSAPWIITAEPGQNINITLVDYAWGDISQPLSRPNECENRYGHILNYDSDDMIEICRGNKRERGILVTSSHQVQFVLDETAVQEFNFLLKFEALGCPNVVPPKNAWLRKEGKEVIIGCHTTSDTWQLKCVRQHWIGAVGNCSSDKIETTTVTMNKVAEFTSNHVMAVGIGCLTLIICCVTITIGAYSIRRYRIKMREQVKSQLCLLPKTSNTNTMISIKPRDTITRNSRPITQATTLPWADMASSGISGSSIPEPFTDDPRSRLPQTLPARNTSEPGYGNMEYNEKEDNESVQYYVLEKPPGYSNEFSNT